MRLAVIVVTAATLAIVGPVTSMGQISPLGSEFQINTYTPDSQAAPDIASGPNNTFVVTWEDFRPGSNDVFAQRFDGSGNAVGTEFRVNNFTGGTHRFPAVSTDVNGDSVFVWTSYSAGIFGRVFDSSWNPIGTEFQANTTPPGSNTPDVAKAANGDFVVVWDQDFFGGDGSQAGVFGQRFDKNTIALGTEFLVNTYTTNSQGDPAAAAVSDGSFIITWNGAGAGDPSGVFARRFAGDGTPLDSEFQVNSYTTYTQGGEPAVAAGTNANFVVTWPSNLSAIMAQPFDSAGTALVAEIQVSFDYGLIAQDVAVSPGGRFVVVWGGGTEHQPLGTGDVYGRLFDSTGTGLGTRFQVNTYTTGGQGQPAVAFTSESELVVVWTGAVGQDGSGNGIFGQRFQITLPPPRPSSCSNGVVDPAEECDLGAENCAPTECCSSGCTNDCKVTGRCTGSSTCCIDASDCPPAEGCCGNGEVESSEECDDANLQDGDCCSSMCTAEDAATCVPLCTIAFGPHLLNPASMKAQFSDKNGDNLLERWKIGAKGKAGNFNLAFGESADCRTESVEVVVVENDGANAASVLGEFTIAPSDWTKTTVKADTDDETCSLSDPDESRSDPNGVAKARIKELGTSLGYKFSGKERAEIGEPQSQLIRVCIQVGDETGSAVLDCEVKGATYKCQSMN